MMTACKLQSVEKSSEYYEKEAVVEYYASGEDSSRQWYGAEALGHLDGSTVTSDDLKLALDGRDLLGNPLQKNRPADRKIGYDLSFAPPKSVSVVWGLAPNKVRTAILKAHQDSVQAALDYINKYHAFTRVGKGGHSKEKLDRLIFARFDHGTSRELDPQLHTHCVMLNIAQRKNGRWCSAFDEEMYHNSTAIGAVYRAELAHQLQANLGLEVERKGAAFEICGVPDKIIKAFSKRKEDMKLRAAELGFSSAKAMDIIAHRTRAAKNNNLSFPELQRDWQEEARSYGYNGTVAKRQGDYYASVPGQQSVLFALNQLTEKKSTFTMKEMRGAIAIAAQGSYGAEGIDQALAKIQDHPEILHLGENGKKGPIFTTKSMWNLEHEMHQDCLVRKNDTRFVVNFLRAESVIKNHPTIKPEQRQMVLDLTTQAGGVKIALGVAGAGKSWALGIAREVWESAGYKVQGLAPTGVASDGLSTGAGIPSQTIARFLAYNQEFDDNTVVVIDEAAMVGSKTLKQVLDKAHEAGAKVILAGDARQLQPIEAGAATRMLRQHLGATELTSFQRQKIGWQRTAAKFFSEGKAQEAMELYHSKGRLKVLKDTEAAHGLLVKEFVKNLVKRPQDTQTAFADTNRQAGMLNLAIRELLKEQGHLTEKLTRIEIKDREGNRLPREFGIGDRILFTQNSGKLGVSNGTFGVIKNIENDKKSHKFSVLTDDGRHVQFSTRDYRRIEHGFATTVHKCQGATLDKAYYLVSDRASSREGSYVAMSRHRLNARMYIDRSSFEDEIDWDFLKGVSTGRKAALERLVIGAASKELSRAQAKDTSADYRSPAPAAEGVLVTERTQKLAMALLKCNKDDLAVKLLFSIATSANGSESPISTPERGLSPVQNLALDILRSKDLSRCRELVRLTMTTKVGYEVSSNAAMKEERDRAVNIAKPLAAVFADAIFEAKDTAPHSREIDATLRRPDVFLNVPFEDKDEAKALGAKWHAEEKLWFVSGGSELDKFTKWRVDPSQATPNVLTSTDAQEQFAEFILSHGYTLKGHPVMNDRWHRIATSGTRGKKTNASYIGTLSGPRPIGTIHDFRTGEKFTWVHKSFVKADPSQKAARRVILAQSIHNREVERENITIQRATLASKLWDSFVPADGSNGYLAKKKVQSFGLRCDKEGNLIIPMRDTAGKIWNFVKVSDDGKRYLGGARKNGCFHLLGSKRVADQSPHIYLAEGYATAATIAQCLDHPVYCSFDATNMSKVADELKAKYPDKSLVVFADNDRHLEYHPQVMKNVGLAKAVDITTKHGGEVVFQDFPDTPEYQGSSYSDFNDYERVFGTSATTDVLRSKTSHLAPSKPSSEEGFLVTKELLTLAEGLKTRSDEREKLVLTSAIASSLQGSRNRLMTPRLEPAPFNHLAREILSGKSAKSYDDLAEMIRSAELGFTVSSNQRMSDFKAALQKIALPAVTKALESRGLSVSPTKATLEKQAETGV